MTTCPAPSEISWAGAKQQSGGAQQSRRGQSRRRRRGDDAASPGGLTIRTGACTLPTTRYYPYRGRGGYAGPGRDGGCERDVPAHYGYGDSMCGDYGYGELGCGYRDDCFDRGYGPGMHTDKYDHGKYGHGGYGNGGYHSGGVPEHKGRRYLKFCDDYIDMTDLGHVSVKRDEAHAFDWTVRIDLKERAFYPGPDGDLVTGILYTGFHDECEAHAFARRALLGSDRVVYPVREGICATACCRNAARYLSCDDTNRIRTKAITEPGMERALPPGASSSYGGASRVSRTASRVSRTASRVSRTASRVSSKVREGPRTGRAAARQQPRTRRPKTKKNPPAPRAPPATPGATRRRHAAREQAARRARLGSSVVSVGPRKKGTSGARPGMRVPKAPAVGSTTPVKTTPSDRAATRRARRARRRRRAQNDL
jgi:hypothetical protein